MNAGFLFLFFRLSCRSHHSPAPFCYISKHVFKVSYKLTYFVVVNKILTVYLTCFSVCFFKFSHTSKLRCQKIDLFVGLKYIV